MYYQSDSLQLKDIHKKFGDGNLEKGIKTVNNEGWEIVSEYFDQATGETYYSVEREKINL
mgnify:CR=1 FL=1